MDLFFPAIYQEALDIIRNATSRNILYCKTTEKSDGEQYAGYIGMNCCQDEKTF